MSILSTLPRQSGDIARGIATTTDHALDSSRLAALDMLDSLRSNSRQLHNALLDTRDATLRSIRREPAKAVLVVAAAGIMVLGLAALLGYLRRRD